MHECILCQYYFIALVRLEFEGYTHTCKVTLHPSLVYQINYSIFCYKYNNKCLYNRWIIGMANRGNNMNC